MSCAGIEIDRVVGEDHISRLAHIGFTTVLHRSNGVEPLVTIAIPTYRRMQLLLEALVSAAAQDTVVPYEVLIVDNDAEGNDDEIINLLSASQFSRIVNLRYIRNAENTGMFGNWNRCLRMANGTWVTILNDDDMLLPEFLSAVLDVISRDPGLDVVACHCEVLDERDSPYTNYIELIRRHVVAKRRGQSAGRVSMLTLDDYFMHNPHHGSLGVLMRTEVAIQMGGFNSNLFPSADFHFFTRLGVAYKSAMLHTVLATYRVLSNESKSEAVATGWVDQGLDMRAAMIKRMPYPRWLLNTYSNLFAINTARHCKKYWRSSLNVKGVLGRHGLPNVPVYPLLLVVRQILKFCVKRAAR